MDLVWVVCIVSGGIESYVRTQICVPNSFDDLETNPYMYNDSVILALNVYKINKHIVRIVI